MTCPTKPWEMEQGILRRSSTHLPPSGINPSPRTVPPLPPKPSSSPNSTLSGSNMTNNYIPYSSSSYGYNSYGSMPYRSSMFGSSYGNYGYNSLNSYGGYGYGGFGSGGYSPYGGMDEAERRFIQYAEESSRNTFASVENIVRAFNSIAMMLDNTFFAMTSSFRAVLSVAENMGRLRTMFGQIWYSVSIFRFINWLYRKVMRLFGVNIPMSTRQAAWTEASNAITGAASPSSAGSSWPTIAFLAALLSAPYFINKLLPKYEDKGSPQNWKTPGTRAKVAFDFIASSQNEMSIRTNDEVLLAPGYIQEEMKLLNSGWAFAVCNGKSGIIPLNYLVLMKKVQSQQPSKPQDVPRNNVKRVSFGENQIFESTDPPPHKIPPLYNTSTVNPTKPNSSVEIEEDNNNGQEEIKIQSNEMKKDNVVNDASS